MLHLENLMTNTKTHADRTKRFQNFEVGDFGMVHLHKHRFPAGTYSKLKTKNFGPCEILKKINDNAFVVDLLLEFTMSATFNISEDIPP